MSVLIILLVIFSAISVMSIFYCFADDFSGGSLVILMGCILMCVLITFAMYEVSTKYVLKGQCAEIIVEELK
ncbi:hypothetical protein M316_0006 [Nitrincola phage 1M3-16]|uniref:hypothetical protein n=1 Tax=Nitrincola phage 1M3-16 TaxID=1472912 RepID=UPI000444D128|nr:hypothetical protein GJ22_gp006 [Nitrincola phage 1M3-16]AHX01071.1 hypothetical protein M316_0006 [Nitrincola phage 1M3-16]